MQSRADFTIQESYTRKRSICICLFVRLAKGSRTA